MLIGPQSSGKSTIAKVISFCLWLEKDVLMLLSKSTLVDEDTVIIVEASLKTGFEYLEELGFTLDKCKKYKTNLHAFISRKE